jgi:signal transduction histidine kinase
MTSETTTPENAEARADDLARRLKVEQKKLRLVQEISTALSSSLDLDHLLTLIMDKVRLLMNADRSTLFLLSDDGKQLWSKVMQGGTAKEIRLDVGEGIAGWVAASGEVVNIEDAYTDKRFQPAVDLRSGYRTTSILCVAMRDTTGQIIGVLQLLNKHEGVFTAEDEELLKALSSQAAISIENSKLYHSVIKKNVALLKAQEQLQRRTNELNILYEIERQVSESTNLKQLLGKLLHQSMMLVSCESGTIALWDDPAQTQLRFMTTAGRAAQAFEGLTIAAGEGVIGYAAKNAEPVILEDPQSDLRHARELSERFGIKPRNLVCVPLVARDGVLGAIELLDKVDGGFTDSDLRMCTLIAGQITRAIQVARAKREQEDQNRLASIGQMLAGVLHDLKTPMTIISGYAQLMAQMDEEDERERYVDQILEQFDIMSGMTREVLSFARGESNLLIRKVYLNRFMQQVAEQLEHAYAGRQIALTIETNYDGVAHFDQQSMLRLIHNLARNAADAMNGKGNFYVEVRSEGDDLCFFFRDDGPGIPQELEGRLFELFASATEGGTGLGLAICKKIVEDHNGTIDYESEPGEGTTFSVKIPLSGGREAA